MISSGGRLEKGEMVQKPPRNLGTSHGHWETGGVPPRALGQLHVDIQCFYQFSTVILAAVRVTGRVSLATFTE
jgi:hypothetical protein